jgi:hypothetical protein
MNQKTSFTILLFVLLGGALLYGQNEDKLFSITVYDGSTGNPLENANVYIRPCNCGGITDNNGRYSRFLLEGRYQITVSYTGFQSNDLEVALTTDVNLETELLQKVEQLSEIFLSAKQKNENVELPQMGVLRLQSQDLIKVPSGLGEYDVLRSMTLLPGVNNAGEVSNGLSIRGGSLDQNLVLFDYAPIYNPTHLFGLFSVFTPDVLSNIDLYRANIPARYGGRTASVLDVGVKKPYADKFKLSGGVGLVSSRLTVETPLVKDKLSLIAGTRAGFTDFLLPIFSKRLKDTKAKFYDTTFKLLWLPNPNDQIFLTGFYSKDTYQLDLISQIDNINSDKNRYDFMALNGTLNWLHTFNEKASLRSIFVSSNYVPKTILPITGSTDEIEYRSKINYLSFISEYANRPKPAIDYYLGLQAKKYVVGQGTLDPGGTNSVLPVALQDENSYELSAYSNINWQLASPITLSLGLRFNHYVFGGPHTFNTYDDQGNIVSAEEFEKGDKVIDYNHLEPRVGANIKLGEQTSFKLSYAQVNQYLQNVYNSTTPLPTSRWKSSDRHIKPQQSQSYGLGIYHNISDTNNDSALELGLEGYYRDSQNDLTYKPGADFFLEEFLEQKVVQGKGRAYGVEFSLKKTGGKVNGWLNYTWSRSFVRTYNENLADRINNNDWFPSDFDRPHIFNGTVNFESNAYNKWSLNFTAQSGRPYTMANGFVQVDDIDVPIYLERNNGRLPVYHRLDFSWRVSYNPKKDKRWKNHWVFTIYNLYARKNPFNIYYQQRTGNQNVEFFGNSPLGAYELSVLNSPLFALTYNFVFQ